MTGLFMKKIDGWWYIRHPGTMKYFEFRFYDETQAKSTMDLLTKAWEINPGLERVNVIDHFNAGYSQCVPAVRNSQ
jgi:hypothetical protein